MTRMWLSLDRTFSKLPVDKGQLGSLKTKKSPRSWCKRTQIKDSTRPVGRTLRTILPRIPFVIARILGFDQLLHVDMKTARWRDKQFLCKNKIRSESRLLCDTRRSWHQTLGTVEDGRVKRVFSQVLAVGFGTPVPDSLVNGAFPRSYTKRKQEWAPCCAKCNTQHTFLNTDAQVRSYVIQACHILKHTNRGY